MRYLRFILIYFLFPVTLSAQIGSYDTLSTHDTIPRRPGELKIAGTIYETTVDTAITLVINEFMAINSELIVDNYGDYDDWLEIYNYGDEAVRLNGLYFTDDPAEPLKWQLDSQVDIMLEPEEYYIIWADDEPFEGNNHASFRLSGDGEYLGIYAGDGSPIDQRYYGIQTSDISSGRYPDAGLSWNFFSEPTPGNSNSTPGAGSILPAISSNLTGGFYSTPVILALYSDVTGATIHYTLDCTLPDSSDHKYTGPVEINSTTIVRAKLIKEGAIDGPVLTISILMEETDFKNPVVSLVAEPEDLFGNLGIISASNALLEAYASMEYIEDRKVIFREGTGIQLHSPKQTRPYSLRLYARNRYGSDWFEYPFFDEKGPDRHKRLILRNSGNDNVNYATTNTHFRDPLIQTIGKISNTRPMISESKPVNVFLNGSYHGLFNLREREDRYYIETHTGITEDFDFIELEFGYYGNIHVIEGSYDSWRSLLTFADTTGDLSLETDYNVIKEMVDLENFTDYWITEVFAGNYDWLSNNMKFWKPENGKWQWLYWDTDHGLGLEYAQVGEVEWNTLYWSLTFSDRAWSNGYNNILIRNLLRNDDYKEYFIRRFTQLLSTSFSKEQTLPLLDSMKNLYQDDMVIHAQQWERSMSNWENAIQIIEDYLQRRPDTVLNHIQSFFGLQDPVPVSIRMEPPGAGSISFSGLDLSSGSLEGRFFPQLTYQLEVSPIPGFSLDTWKPFQSSNPSIEFQLSDTMDIVAYFSPSDQSFPIQLCEVYSNNRKAYDPGDWIEFYYYGSDPLLLEGWTIEGDHGQLLHTFGENDMVSPGQRFVVCEDLNRFKEVYTAPIYCFGDLDQGFAPNSVLVLKASDGVVKKTVDLMSSVTWPELPEEGFSIELKNIVDNTDQGDRWELSENIFGSPGLGNNSIFNFHKPLGKDSVLNNHETQILEFLSSEDFYYDQDRHRLAGISIKDITGPGHLYLDQVRAVQGNIYNPSDLVFTPQEPYQSPSILVYSFTDKSGQESADYTIRFDPALKSKQEARESFRIYPVPAGDFCTFEIPPEHFGPVDFFLYDLNGKVLRAQHSQIKSRELIIDLSEVENGLYLYLFKTRRAVVHGKIEVIK